jgi:hypothetical protein
MPDVGDIVTPQLEVTPFDGTTSAALTIIAPNGTSIPGTGETTSDGGNHWFADPVALTGDVQVLRWVVTGKGASVQNQYVQGVPAPTGAILPTPLATIADVVARTGALSDEELIKVPGLLADASTKVRGYVRRQFTAVSNQELVLRPRGNVLQLPREVLAVDLVEAIGREGDVALDGWYWDGIDRVYLGRPWPDDGTDAWDETANSYRVTLDMSGTIPDGIKTKVVEMTIRHLDSKSNAAGVVNEKIGKYSYLMDQARGSAGRVVVLTQDDKQDLIEAGFRRVAGTTTMSVV